MGAMSAELRRPPDGGPSPSLGLAIAALVLGILGLVLSPLLVGGVLGLVGLGLGAVYLRSRPERKGMARWGMALGSVGLVASVGAGVLYYRLYREFRSQMQSYEDASEGPAEAPDWAGTLAPAMKLTTLDGESVELAQFAGRPVVLTFWATWCQACRNEVPHLNRLAREVPDVVVLAVSDEPEPTLRAFAKERQVEYRVASLPTPPAPFDQVRSLPTTVFIDRKGVVREAQVGALDFDEMRSRATAPDHAGPGRTVPTPVAANPAPRQLAQRWSLPVESPARLATCQWDADGAPDLLVAAGPWLRVIDAAGKEKARLSLPGPVGQLECASLPDGSLRLLAYESWGAAVSVSDGSGKPLWSYHSGEGVNGAHWGDLDGDGQPEVVVGMNGGGGLHAVSLGGRQLWHVSQIGNVWGQAVVSGSSRGGPLVAATEAGGSVRLFDGEGTQTAELRPLEDYYTAVAGAAVDAEGTVQLVAAGRTRVVAFDTAGKVAWQVPAKRPQRTPGFFAYGDLTGDGVGEWVFPVRSRALLVASTQGERLAELVLSREASFAVLPGAGPGLVVVAGDALRAYALE